MSAVVTVKNAVKTAVIAALALLSAVIFPVAASATEFFAHGGDGHGGGHGGGHGHDNGHSHAAGPEDWIAMGITIAVLLLIILVLAGVVSSLFRKKQ